jgi:hypothetical protein
VAVGLLCPLLVAAMLRPDPSGHGTHRQLGFPPCTFVVLFGHRCPSCGMTTAWAHLVRGQLPAALRSNVGGTLLGLLDLVATAWLLASAVRERWLGMAPNPVILAWILTAVVAVTLIDWGVRMLAG